MAGNIPFPLPFKRQFAGSLDQDEVFQTTVALNNYLTSPLRYAGQIVTCVEQPDKIFVMNPDRTAWTAIETGGGGGGGTVTSVVAGAGVAVNSADPANPVVSASITADTTKNVPADFATLNLALAWAKTLTVVNGAQVNITIDATETITEGLDIKWLGAPWLNIIFDAAGVPVDGSLFPPDPLFGAKAFALALGSRIGSISGKLLPANVGDVTLSVGYLSDISFGNPFAALTFDAGSGWMQGVACAYGCARLFGPVIGADGFVLSATSGGEVLVENYSLTGGSAVTSAAQANGGSIQFAGSGSLTAANVAASADNGRINFSAGTVSGSLYAGYGGVVDGFVEELHTPVAALTIPRLCDAQSGGIINVQVTTGITVSAPNLDANLAYARYTGGVSISSMAVTGTSTGKIAEVHEGGTVNATVTGGLAAFTGGTSQSAGLLTEAGLIRVADTSEPYPANWAWVSLLNSWANIGGTAQAAQFRRIGDMVQVRFAIENGTASTLFTLPTGCRPPADIGLSCQVHDNTGAPDFGHLKVIAASGDVQLEHPGSLSNHKAWAVFEFSVTA